jgi:hypothetical protein
MRFAGISTRMPQSIRAHLPLLATGCLTLQLPVLVLVFIFRVPQTVFDTASFRGIALLYLVCFVLARKRAAGFGRSTVRVARDINTAPCDRSEFNHETDR